MIFTGRRFPTTRLRRNRRRSFLRELVQVVRLSCSDLVQPIFIMEGNNKKEAIKSMPGISRLSVDLAVEKVAHLNQLEIPAVGLFPAIGQEKKNRRRIRGYQSERTYSKRGEKNKRFCSGYRNNY